MKQAPRIVWTGILKFKTVHGEPYANLVDYGEWKDFEIRLLLTNEDTFVAEWVRNIDRLGVKQWQEGIENYQMEQVLSACILSMIRNEGKP